MFFRKGIGFLLAFFLLISQSGMALTVHYCGDQIASVKPVLPFSDSGDCCGKPERKPMSCCKDKIVKAEKDHHSIVKTLSLSVEAVALAEVSLVNASFSLPPSVNTATPAASGFHANGPPLYCLYQQYVFYA